MRPWPRLDFRRRAGRAWVPGLCADAAPRQDGGKRTCRMTDRSYLVPGLHEPAEIRVDRWGIPHIRAASRRDVFLAQGFNAARDRLWQLDLWRKRGLGLLAADHGPRLPAQARACRLFLYRGDMDAEWAANGPEAKQIVTAFVAGINAFV